MRLNLIYLVVYLSFFSHTVHSQKLTLKECIQLAIDKHPEIAIGKLNYELSATQVNQAKSAAMPSISADIFQSGNFGRSIDRFTNSYIDQFYNTSYAGLGFSLPIFTSSRIKNQVNSATFNNEADAVKIQSNINALTFTVITSYVSALSNLEIISNLKGQYKADSLQYQKLLKRKQAGLIIKTDETQILNQLKTDEMSIAEAQLNYKVAIIELCQFINTPYNETIQLSPIYDYNIIDIDKLKVSFENLPQIQELKLRMKAQEANIKAIKAMNMPTINLNGNYGSFFASSNKERSFLNQLNDTRNGSISLGLSIPILASLQNKSMIEGQKIQHKIIQSNIEKTLLTIQQDHNLAIARYQSLKQRFENAKYLSALAQENRDVISDQVNAGVMTTVEFLIAQNSAERAANTATQAKYLLIIQEMILNFYSNNAFVIE